MSVGLVISKTITEECREALWLHYGHIGRRYEIHFKLAEEKTDLHKGNWERSAHNKRPVEHWICRKEGRILSGL